MKLKEFTPAEVIDAYGKCAKWLTTPSCFLIPQKDWVVLFGVDEDVAVEFASEIIDQWNGEALERQAMVVKEAVYKIKS